MSEDKHKIDRDLSHMNEQERLSYIWWLEDILEECAKILKCKPLEVSKKIRKIMNNE